MEAPLLHEAKEWAGEWWLPESPEDRVAGVLRYDPEDGLELQLIGGWDYRVTVARPSGGVSILQETQRWPVVLGQARGKLMTLLDLGVRNARSFGMTAMFGTPNELVLHAATALEGCHLLDPSESEFIRGEITVENLTAWSRRTGIEVTRNHSVEVGESLGGISSIRLPPLECVLSNGIRAELSTVEWYPFREERRSEMEANIREHASVTFLSEELLPLEELISYMSSIGDLVGQVPGGGVTVGPSW